jgi:hypothetical protein
MEGGGRGSAPAPVFRLFRDRVIAIVPPSRELRTETEDAAWDYGPDETPPLTVWVRGLLLGIAASLSVVFLIAWRLDPYERDEEGRALAPRRQETHRQLGLPPCTFYSTTGLPCPSCGMTTSFALLMHGDLINSLRANAVGTLMALIGLVTVPWAVVSVWRGRTPFIRSLEKAVSVVVVVLFTLMLLRWGFVLLLRWLGG